VHKISAYLINLLVTGKDVIGMNPPEIMLI
jgi:hypothetical protein